MGCFYANKGFSSTLGDVWKVNLITIVVSITSKLFTPVFIHIFYFVDEPSFKATSSKWVQFRVMQGLSVDDRDMGDLNVFI